MWVDSFFKTIVWAVKDLAIILSSTLCFQACSSGSEDLPPNPKSTSVDPTPNILFVEYYRNSADADLQYANLDPVHLPTDYLPTQALGLVSPAGAQAENLIPLYRCEGTKTGSENRFSFTTTTSDCAGHNFSKLLTALPIEVARIYSKSTPTNVIAEQNLIPLYRYTVAARSGEISVLSTVEPTQELLNIMRYRLDPTLGSSPLGYIKKIDGLLDGNKRWIAGYPQNLCYGISKYQTSCPRQNQTSIWRLKDLRTATDLLVKSLPELGMLSLTAQEIRSVLSAGLVSSPELKSNSPLLLTAEVNGSVIAAKNIRILRTPFISQYDNLSQKDDDGDALTGLPTKASALLMANQMTAHTAYSDPLLFKTFDPALFDGITYAAFYRSDVTSGLDRKQVHSFQVMDEQGVLVGAENDSTIFTYQDPGMGGERFNPVTGQFELAVTTFRPWTTHPMALAFSNDVETGDAWLASHLADGVPSTIYSSQSFSNSTNDRGTLVAAWMAANQNVTSLHLTARMSQGIALGFPRSYSVYVSDPLGTTWLKVGDYTDQPNPTGLVRINFPQVYSTNGVQIVPHILGSDGASYRFQLADINFVSYAVPLDFANESAVASVLNDASKYLSRLYSLGIHLSHFSFSEVGIENANQIVPWGSPELTHNNARLPYYYSPTFSEASYRSFSTWLRANHAPVSFQALPVLPSDFARAVASNNPQINRIQSTPAESELWNYWARWRRETFNSVVGRYGEKLKETSSHQSYIRSPLIIMYYNWPNWTSFNGQKVDMSISLNATPTDYYTNGLLLPNASDSSQIQSFGPTVYVENGTDFEVARSLYPNVFDYFVYEVKYLNDSYAIREAQRMIAFKNASPTNTKIGLHVDMEYPQYRDSSNYMNTNMSQVFPGDVKRSAFDLVWNWEAQCEYVMSMKTPDEGFERLHIDFERAGLADSPLHEYGGYAPLKAAYPTILGNYCLYRHERYNLQHVCSAPGVCTDAMPMPVLKENMRRLLDWRAKYLEAK